MPLLHPPEKKNLALHLNKQVFVLSLVEIDPVVLEKRFLNTISVFSLYHYYLPLKTATIRHLNNGEFPSSKEALSQVWLTLTQWFRKRRYSLNGDTFAKTAYTTDKF